MKKSSLFIILTLIFGLTITSYVGDTECKVSSNDVNTFNVVAQAEDSTITIRDIADFLEQKSEHYPLSDEFIERYQQTDGGYIDYAKKTGHLVDKERHEPNQKWHFFDSWLYPSIDDGSLTWDADAKRRVYTNLLCPELLLWIYEAAEVNPVKVRNAKIVAEQGKSSKTNISTIAKNMRACVPWEDIQQTILNQEDDPRAKIHSVFVNESNEFIITGLQNEYEEGSQVTFTINVTDLNKIIKEVKVNNSVLQATEKTTYTFIMPKVDVNITITLQEIKKAVSVLLVPNTLELTVRKADARIIANVEPSDTSDIAKWSISEGSEFISIIPNGNEVMVHPIKEGIAKVLVSYNENVGAECMITVNASTDLVEPIQTLAKYNIKYDLGARKTAKKLDTVDELLSAFEIEKNYDNIITAVSEMDYIYGGGYGGSGDTNWYTGDMIKFGTTSVNGSMTLALNTEVNRIKITGYVSDNTSKIRIGDGTSSDWTTETSDNKTTLVTCTNMNVINKDIVEENQTTTITIDFESTRNLKIATTNKKPLYITSIEFIVVTE